MFVINYTFKFYENIMTIASLLMSFRHLMIFLTKIWALFTMLFKKKVRAVCIETL